MDSRKEIFITYIGDKPETYIPGYNNLIFKRNIARKVPQEIAERILRVLHQEFRISKPKKEKVNDNAQ